jgi:hypothetical protein
MTEPKPNRLPKTRPLDPLNQVAADKLQALGRPAPTWGYPALVELMLWRLRTGGYVGPEVEAQGRPGGQGSGLEPGWRQVQDSLESTPWTDPEAVKVLESVGSDLNPQELTSLSPEDAADLLLARIWDVMTLTSPNFPPNTLPR